MYGRTMLENGNSGFRKFTELGSGFNIAMKDLGN